MVTKQTESTNRLQFKVFPLGISKWKQPNISENLWSAPSCQPHDGLEQPCTGATRRTELWEWENWNASSLSNLTGVKWHFLSSSSASPAQLLFLFFISPSLGFIPGHMYQCGCPIISYAAHPAHTAKFGFYTMWPVVRAHSETLHWKSNQRDTSAKQLCYFLPR